MGSPKKAPPANLRPRHEPPTLEEALFAAEGFIDARDQQIEFAAELMCLPVETVRPQAEAFFKAQANRVTVEGGRRPLSVVVEQRKAPTFSIERRNAAPAFSFERKPAGSKFVVETRAKRIITLPR